MSNDEQGISNVEVLVRAPSFIRHSLFVIHDSFSCFPLQPSLSIPIKNNRRKAAHRPISKRNPPPRSPSGDNPDICCHPRDCAYATKPHPADHRVRGTCPLRGVFAPGETRRGHPPEPGASPGTGIGLYMVKQMVENYGGSIAVESQLGQGTRFKVLPGLTVFTGLMPGSRRQTILVSVHHYFGFSNE